MGKADRISGIFWLIFSVCVSVESYRMGLGSLRQPGPGFLFFWVSVVIGIMSLVIFIREWRQNKTEGSEIPIFEKLNVSKLVLVLISVFLYALLIETVGFILVTWLLFVFLLGIIEKKRWPFTIFVSTAVTAVAYLVFEVWLQSQLPKGLLEFLRF
jgi:putative tricarboxylic transport membrane protein